MIVIITCVFPPEQIVSANLSKDIAYKLAEEGQEVHVISPRPSRPYGQTFDTKNKLPDGIHHHVAKSYVHAKSNFLGRLIESVSFGLASKKFIDGNHKKISRIYANTWPIFAQYFAVRAAKRYNIPIAMHVQDVYPESYVKKAPKLVGSLISSIIMPFERYVMGNSSDIIAISKGMKDYLLSTRPIKEENAHVVRNWQDDDFLSKPVLNKDGENKRFTFMYAGSVSSSAGVDLLIKAFSNLGEKESCRLVIAGSGSDKEYCMKLAKDYQFIEFWDAPYEKIPEIQSQADILLLSLKRGIGKTATPSKFIAYLFSKKPVIASIDEDCDTANSIYVAKCGFVVPPEDEKVLRKQMEDCLGNTDEELKTLGNNGFAYAQEFLSRKSNLKKITSIISNNKM